MRPGRSAHFSPFEKALAASPVLLIPVLVGVFVRALPQNAWDWTREITLVLSWAQVPSLLVAVAWCWGWPRAAWGNAVLVVVALVWGVMGWLPSPVVWPTVLINLPGLLVALVSLHRRNTGQRPVA